MIDMGLKRAILAIEENSLPKTFDELFSEIWDDAHGNFAIQENSFLDFKQDVPENFANGYGLGIVRLAIAFHNTYGGIVIFGVQDSDFSISGLDNTLDIESFNRCLSDFTSESIECVARDYWKEIGGIERRITTLLVPKREKHRPTRLIRKVDKYDEGTLWIRERHEVLTAQSHHLPFLYGTRETTTPETEAKFPVHRAFPPSPATMQKFVSRDRLTVALWDWFVLSDQPRFYLHGPGGSGKSTLAFEFAKSIAENGHSIQISDQPGIDYVIYLSAKETELHTPSGKIKSFDIQQFQSKEEQFSQISYLSGFATAANNDDLAPTTATDLKDLFDNFTGIVVIDDIDALSRKGKDTGEEELFISLLKAQKRNRVLYTLRFPPSHAVNSSRSVPGLEFETEFHEFLNLCAEQFEVVPPQAQDIPLIAERTSRLPLLIETIIGLRKHSGSYPSAMKIFNEKGGAEARRYLYQREYDRLDSAGKARHVLCALLLLGEPISFEALSGLFIFPNEQIVDAISEARSIFLSTFEGRDGETLFQITPPAIPFLANVSTDLFYYNQLSATIQHFKNVGLKASPEEASLIVRFERLIRKHEFGEVKTIYEQIPRESPVLANPNVKSLAAQAFSELGPSNREKARELFKQAVALGFIDIFMMRRWYNMELSSGYGISEAQNVCEIVLQSPKSSARGVSEFWSKKGSCESRLASSLFMVNKDKAILHLHNSIICYLEGLRIGKPINELDTTANLEWLEKPLGRLISLSKENYDQYFILIEKMADLDHDIDPDGAALILRYMKMIPISSDVQFKKMMRGVLSRVISKLNRVNRASRKRPNLAELTTKLEIIRDHFSR